MAGKRQHYVPKLLQRGFLCKTSREAERTWLHRCGADARLVSINHVGVEDWFYSRKSLDGTQTLDDVITALESDLGGRITELRASAPGSRINGADAARTVVHLVMRTAHIRRVMSAGIKGIVKEVGSVFSDPARLSDMMGLTRPVLGSLALDSIRENAKKLVPLGIPTAFSERFAAFHLREFGNRIAEQTAMASRSVFPHLFKDLADKLRAAHNSTLASSLESSKWIDALEAFDWIVETGENLILPDAVALARDADGPLMPFLLTKADIVRSVVMPLSPDRILVGHLAGSEPIDLGHFNIEAAASCESFFIGAKPFDDDRLTAIIGSAPAKAIEEAISAAVREAETSRSTVQFGTTFKEPAALTEQAFAYSVRLADFGDEILAKEFADVLHGVVGVLARELPLHELDGITLAVDYRGALATVDRGDPNLPPVASGALGYGLGVAKSVTVVRDGTSKEHLVVAASIANLWLSPDAKVRATGIYTLVKMLAGIAHGTSYAEARAINFTPDTMKRELHLAVAAAPAGYWSARHAAFVDPDQGQVFADLVIESLEFGEREMSAERSRIPENGDISSTLKRALECVSAVLDHATDWLGHRDGLAEDQVFLGSDLPERLKARGLDHWIELFGRDLAACYNPEGALDLEIATNLSQHVERLFWYFGIYCWPEDSDMRCLVTDRFFLPAFILV